MPRLPLMLVLALSLAACSDPEPDPLPEPQAAAPAAAGQATELRDAIQEPIDKAKAVEAMQAEDEAQRQQALEDAGG